MLRERIEELIGFMLVLQAVCFPFQYHLIGFHTHLVRFLFAPLDVWIARSAGFQPVLADLSSDSISLYAHVLVIGLLSVFLFLVFNSNKTPTAKTFWKENHRTILVYFLALILLKYGLDKIFLIQFPAPEPNILFTPVGKMDRDILFWTSMGSSPLFNWITGYFELITGIMLLFRRTRSLGNLFAMGVFGFILTINLSFDISVKLFSTLLLLTSIYTAWPVIRKLWKLLVQKKAVWPEFEAPRNRSLSWIKIAILTIIALEAFFPYYDLNEQTIPLHGAYENLDQGSAIRRVFFHRDGYLIFQDREDTMTDFKASIDQIRREITLINYDNVEMVLEYRIKSDGTISVRFNPGDEILRFKKIDHQSLPLLDNRLHWTVDGSFKN